MTKEMALKDANIQEIEQELETKNEKMIQLGEDQIKRVEALTRTHNSDVERRENLHRKATTELEAVQQRLKDQMAQGPEVRVEIQKEVVIEKEYVEREVVKAETADKEIQTEQQAVLDS